MPQTNRLVFDVGDLRVLMRCPDCEVELSFSPGSNQRVPMGCPNCKSSWNLGDPAFEQAYQWMNNLRSALHVIANGEMNTDKFDVQLEIDLNVNRL